MKDKCTEEQFLRSVKDHQMTILREDGLHRHIRFKAPDTGNQYFDLITWPGWLCYCGDMGTYVFRRLEDMFQFFRNDRHPRTEEGKLYINTGYWAEKVEAEERHSGVKAYCPDFFEEQIRNYLESREASPEVISAAEEEILRYSHDGEYLARHAAAAFEHDGFKFDGFWDFDCTTYTYRFIWCCYALAWGIKQYDESKALEVIS